MNVTFVNKTQDSGYDPLLWNADDANEVKNAINSKADQSELLLKADKINGTVPLTQLPSVYFSGVSGTGTQSDPYVVSGTGGQASAENYLKGLAGYSETEDRILYVNNGLFSWGAVPSGNLEKLATPVLVLGNTAFDAISISWNTVINATSYSLQRDIDASFASSTTVYTGANRQFTDSGLASNTGYFYRLRANASGFAPSNFATTSGKTLLSGNITPATPTAPITNDTLDTFSWTNSDGYSVISSYEYTLDYGATYAQLTEKPLQVGNVVAPIGKIGVRVKADTGRNVSGTLFNALAFTLQPVKAAAPTVPVTNDVANTFNFTYNPSFSSISSYEYTVNSGNTYTQCTEKPIFIGDINKGIGQVGVRVKATTSVIASDTLFNAVPFFGTDGLIPINTWIEYEGFIPSGNTLAALNDNNLNRARSSAYLPSGVEGSVQFYGNGRLGLDDNPSVLAYGNQFNYALYRNSATGKIASSVAATYTDVAIVNNNCILRMRATSTTIYFGYSIDNGLNWVEPKNTTRAAGDLYVKADEGYSRLDRLENILGSGILVNGSLI